LKIRPNACRHLKNYAN